MGYRSKYNRRLRAAKRMQKRLAIAALLCVTVSAAAFMTLRETLPAPSSAYAEADAAPARPVAQTVAAISAPSAHAGARRVYPFSIVPGGVSGREEVVHVLQTDQVVAQHYAGLQVARLGTVTVSKPRAVYVSYRKGDKVYWTAQKVMLAQGETLLSDGSNEIRGRCGNRISDVPRLPVEANGPTMAMLDAAMDLDADEGDDGERQASTSSSDTSADSASNAAQPQSQFLSGYAYSGGAAPGFARPPMLLAMSGMAGGAAPLSRPASLSATPTTMLSTQTSVASDSSVSSGTPGTTGASGTTGNIGTTTGDTSGSGTGSGTGTDSGTSGGDAGATSGTSGTSGTGGGSGGTSDTPPKTTLLPGVGDPSDDTTTVDMPPLPESLSEPGSLPVIIPKAPLKNNAVPEPDSLWLSGAALAALLLARRKPRRSPEG